MDEVDSRQWTAVERLYRQEIRMLQAGDYQQWLGLLANDVRYRAPVVRVVDHRDDDVGKPGDLAYYDEDRTSLELRVNKLASAMAWTEIPPSRLRYFIQLTDLSVDDIDFTAVSNFLVIQTRHEASEHFFYGERTDRLRPDSDTFVIAERNIVLDRVRLPSENLSLFF